MAFPAQVFYSILEVSVRWGCSVTQVVNNAIADELDLVTGVSQIMLGEECVAGLTSVPGCAVRPLFRPFGKGAKKIYLTEARLPPNDPWQTINKPARGVRLTAADIMITAKEIDRFEEDHGIGRTRSVGPGAPLKYDWDGFYIAVLKRIYSNGFPARQRDLVVEMQEWFVANSAEGDAPDESTIRRRIQAVWKELNPA
ncbi:hypothetical protein [Tabrizicola sp.]|uniref:hypothetical protein n=1 Tax=Tabrizicola sp. TaxID=2005166 RepID=UPI00286A0242|nr:hypothetical protein [Tabrizicola sp.]